jgi:hypothetical protein
MKQAEINRIRDKAVDGCRNVSCEDILLKSKITYRRQGNQIYCFCPFCDRDKFLKDLSEAKAGEKQRSFVSSDISDHFSVNTEKNMFFCFTCSQSVDSTGRKRSAGGGSAKLYSLLNGIPYIDAALTLSLGVGKITEEEFRNASSSPDAISKFKKGWQALENFDSQRATKEAEVKAPANLCNLVYSALLSMPEFALDGGQKEYLLNERHLSEKEIKKVGFFTYAHKFSVDSLVEKIRTLVPQFSHKNLYGVPGFFFESTGEGVGKWRFKNPMPYCLGIPLRNGKGQIVALQMRNMTANAKNKYFYVSSKYESSKNKAFGYGASPSTPIAVCYPEQLNYSTFYIGEGIFKMLEVAKEGAVSFSVQGVNSLSYVADEIKAVMQGERIKKLPTSLRGTQNVKLCIVFDADMYEKIQVLEAALRASVHFSKEFPQKEIYFLLWKPEYGKGFDDMKFSCLKQGTDYHKKIKAVPQNIFLDFVKTAIAESDREYFGKFPDRDRDVAERKKEEYGKILYKNLYTEKISKILP